MPELELDDGARLAWQEQGRGDVVLLVQGVGVAGAGWRPQLAGLADGWRLVAFDNRGIGASTLGAEPLSVGRMARDALALLDHLGAPRAHVVGHSLGGLVAQELALAAPARVRSLSLLCTFARGRDVTAPTPWLIWMGLRTRVGSRGMRRRAFVEMVTPPADQAGAGRDALAASLGAVFGRDLADSPPIALRQLRAMSGHDTGPRLAALAPIPTLVVSAALDRIAPPRLGRRLADGIPGARFVELAGAAHAVPVQAPERVNALLREHLTAADV